MATLRRVLLLGAGALVMIGFDKIEAPAWLYFFTAATTVGLVLALGEPIRWRAISALSLVWIVVAVVAVWPTTIQSQPETLAAVKLTPEDSSTKEANARIFVTGSVWDLVRPFRGNTEYQATKLFEAFQGKWIVASSHVWQVSKGLSNDVVVTGYVEPENVTFAPAKALHTIMLSMSFPLEREGSVTHFRRDDPIKAECQIKSGSE